MRGVRVLLPLVCMVAAVLTAPTAPAAAATGCPAGSTGPAGHRVAALPWAQRRYDPRRLAGISDGAGITVAVIDSGVDARHPQLRGDVLAGHDYLPGSGSDDGRTDCVSHGTGVASLIAARPAPDQGLVGLAPAVRILPLRVSETVEGRAGGRAGTAAGLAHAIAAAVQEGALVLNVSMVLYRDDARVRQAVADALRHGAVVVAAVGNGHRDGAASDPAPYPASYPGVLGVGAIDENGQRLAGSQVGSYVDIMAPGVGVTVAAAGGGLALASGTSFATPFVAGTAALILSRARTLSRAPVPPGDVAARIVGTADPSPDGPHSARYGYGILNPYRAVTETAPARMAALPVPPARRIGAAGGAAGRTRIEALQLAGAGLGLAAAVLLLAAVLPRGARRRWRPGRA